VTDALNLTRLAELDERPVFFSTEHGWWNGRRRFGIYGLRDGDVTLHYTQQGRPWAAASDAELGDQRLFDLAADPTQRRDLSREDAATTEALLDELLEHLHRTEQARPAQALSAGSATLQMLRDIGYIGDDEDNGEH
jgi:hypothetical protein